MAFINHDQTWDWQVEDCYFADFNVSQSESNESYQSENISYTCDGENTPVKAMMEHAYLLDNVENKNKREHHWSESCRQSKRRRVLHFDEVIDSNLSTDEANSSIIMTSNDAGDSVDEVLSRMSNWLCEDADDTYLPFHESLDQSFEGWLSSCLTESDIEPNPDEIDAYRPSDVNNKANGMQNLLHIREPTTMPKCPIRIRHNVNFEGKKSFKRTSDSSTASVAYPFTFLKPCGFSGDVTLKDINRRVHTPPKLQDDFICYSAFSGKPVVAKTKLRTGGGKGSITILRTKG
ncbi:hypothetical protein LIER_20727 [Lithospermum erythrorhizon]|uniref:Protein XRI1 n=1 Tax=Lithospermum erythrorhizon TaxID=34254 RepID=A0AAV3QMK4_LITER